MSLHTYVCLNASIIALSSRWCYMYIKCAAYLVSGWKKDRYDDGLWACKRLLTICDLPSFVGKQIGRIKSVIGTRSFNLSSAMSLSKLRKLNFCVIARSTNRVSGRIESLQRSCSPNVTLIMNHMKL